VDPHNPESLPTPADDFVAQLAERLSVPRDTAEVHLGELLIAYHDVARARTGQSTRQPYEIEVEPEVASIAPS